MLPTHCMGYYIRIQVIGSANPLLLDKNEKLDDAFYGYQFCEGEGFSTLDAKQIKRNCLPYEDNLLRPHMTLRDEDPVKTVADCVRRADRAWARALALYESVKTHVPKHRRDRFIEERRLLRHLGHLWHTWANAEEFYRLRGKLAGPRFNCYWNEHFRAHRRRILSQMLAIAKDELQNVRRAWANVRGDERLDVSLRLDTPTAPMNQLYEAKFRHTRKVRKTIHQQLRSTRSRS